MYLIWMPYVSYLNAVCILFESRMHLAVGKVSPTTGWICRTRFHAKKIKKNTCLYVYTYNHTRTHAHTHLHASSHAYTHTHTHKCMNKMNINTQTLENSAPCAMSIDKRARQVSVDINRDVRVLTHIPVNTYVHIHKSLMIHTYSSTSVHTHASWYICTPC